jgi:hypothetical protein
MEVLSGWESLLADAGGVLVLLLLVASVAALVLGQDVDGVLARAVVVGGAVERLVGYDVVFEQGLEELGAELAEEEGVGAGTEFLECCVCGCEECASFVLSAVDDIKQAGVFKTKSKGAERAGKMSDDTEAGRWRNKNAINAMNKTIGGRLDVYVSGCS